MMVFFGYANLRQTLKFIDFIIASRVLYFDLANKISIVLLKIAIKFKMFLNCYKTNFVHLLYSFSPSPLLVILLR